MRCLHLLPASYPGYRFQTHLAYLGCWFPRFLCPGCFQTLRPLLDRGTCCSVSWQSEGASETEGRGLWPEPGEEKHRSVGFPQTTKGFEHNLKETRFPPGTLEGHLKKMLGKDRQMPGSKTGTGPTFHRAHRGEKRQFEPVTHSSPSQPHRVVMKIKRRRKEPR